MKTTHTLIPLRWGGPSLVTGLLLLSGVAVADHQKFPATGQTTCSDTAGNVIDCAGTGQDGDIQAGATLRYRDNGNGTITDKNTRLVWEKKSDEELVNDGNNTTTFPHDKDNEYTWDEAFVHAATLNTICANDETVTCSVNADCVAVGGKCGFAGKRDWRVPNIKELQSIVNYGVFNPSMSPVFNTNCVAGATVLTGSCTESTYWSSTSALGGLPRRPSFDAGRAWNVSFRALFVGGFVSIDGKSNPLHVRAVRGGL